MTKELFTLLQLCDSNFPSGAFSHSFGFETYIQDQVVTDKESFKHALSIYIKKQLVYVDGLACRLTYESLKKEAGLNGIINIDHILYFSNLGQETRNGNRRIGERMAILCMELYPSPSLRDYLSMIKQKQAYGHSALVFAIVAHHLTIRKTRALEAYLFATVSSLVQNAVRGIPLGQTDGQRLLVDIQTVLEKATETIQHLSIDDLGAVSPGLEIAQMRHERLPVRLFMS